MPINTQDTFNLHEGSSAIRFVSIMTLGDDMSMIQSIGEKFKL